MSNTKRLSVADVKAEGFVEGVDFYINHSGLPVPLTPNKIRPCEACGNKKAHFYSALHRKCRTCRRREQDGVVPGSAGAIAREAARLEKCGGLSSVEAKKQAVAAHQKELAARILARRRLLQFIRKFHPGYQAGWVHEDICRRLERFLQAVADKKSPRLLLFCPPRLGKSLIASQYFPAWMLGQHPQFEIIAASYNISLPTGFSRRIRELVRDPEYTAMFPDCVLSEESQAVESWRTTAGGGYTAAGVGTGITGKGCHCFPAGTLIQTEYGTIPIDGLYRSFESTSVRAVAYDHDSEQLVLKPISAVKESYRADIVEIETAAGRRIVATADHPFFVRGTGYVEAAQLPPGATLVVHTMQRGVHQTGVCSAQGSGIGVQGSLLLEGVQSEAPRREERTDVPPVRSADSREASEVLLRCLPAGCTSAEAGEGMYAMRGGISAEVVADEILLTSVRRGSALCSDAGRRKPALRGWNELRAVVPGDALCSVGAGLTEMRRVQQPQGFGGAPYQCGPDGQQGGEPHNPLPDVSCSAPQVGYDTVLLVRRVRTDEIPVYDLQVEGTHNFFAEEVLVHNCLIVDDPVKDQEAADSANIREATWEWYLSTAYTRIAPGGGVLGIQTRWNDDDWSGRIIMAMDTGEGEKFEIVSYPAINEQGDEYLMPDDSIVQIAEDVTPPEGAQLLRLKGSALHPDRYDIGHLQRIKKNFTAAGNVRMWSALYQQNPVPEEGAFFRRDMFKYISYVPDVASMQVYQAWDFSITEKETSDWIVGYCLGQDEFDNVYELDMIRFKSDENAFTIADAILDFYRKWPTFLVGFEDGQIWKSIKAVVMRRAEELRLSLNYETLTPLSDKLVRAGPLRGRMQMGKMYFQQNAPFRQTVDQELLRFPGGKHDDIVDAAAWATRLALTHQPPAPVKAKPMPSWKDGLFRAKRGESHMAA